MASVAGKPYVGIANRGDTSVFVVLSQFGADGLGIEIEPGHSMAWQPEAGAQFEVLPPRIRGDVTEEILLAIFKHIRLVREQWPAELGLVFGDYFRYDRGEDVVRFCDEWGNGTNGEIPLRAFYDFDGAVAEARKEREESLAERAEAERGKDLKNLERLASKYGYSIAPPE